MNKALMMAAVMGGRTDPLLVGLISYWKLDEFSNGSAPVARADSVGANHLTDVNTTPSAEGRVGNGADFEFTNSECLYVDSNATLQMTATSFTLAFWMKFESFVGTDIQIILGKYNNADNKREYACYYDPTTDNKMHFNVSQDGTVVSSASSDNVMAINTWYLVICYFDLSEKKAQIAVNGVAGTAGAAITGSFTSDSPFIIGARGKVGAFTKYLDGIVDEVRLWKRLLTASEKTSLDLLGGGTATYSSSIGV